MTRISLLRTIFFGFLCAIWSAFNTLESSINSNSYTNGLSLKYFTKQSEFRTTITSQWNEVLRSWSYSINFFPTFFFLTCSNKGQIPRDLWNILFTRLGKIYSIILKQHSARNTHSTWNVIKFSVCIATLITRIVERHTKKKWEYFPVRETV